MGIVLKTPRLSLRNLDPGDSGFLVELMNEPPYIEHIGDRGVRTAADGRRYIEEKYAASYARHGYGLYLVERVEGAEPIGICGLVRRESLDHPDLGFAFLHRYGSRGDLEASLCIRPGVPGEPQVDSPAGVPGI
jgi:RimJ/RimL family protein N-acetyltransferase